jgi:hypothetical protein
VAGLPQWARGQAPRQQPMGERVNRVACWGGEAERGGLGKES